MRSVRPTSLFLLLTVVATLSGCASAPGPRAWAASVCSALAPWRAEIGTLALRTQQQMSAHTTPPQAKENLTRLFDGARAASEKARAGVVSAGVPDVDGGADVAKSFTASLTAVRDAYGRAKSGIEALATSPSAAFYSKVAGVVQQLQADYARSQPDTSRLDSVELKRAFDEVPECR